MRSKRMLDISEIVERKFEDVVNLDDEWSINSDTGWQPVSKVCKTVEYQVYSLKLENGMNLDCADTHIVFRDDNSQAFVKDLCNGDSILTEVGPVRVENIHIRDLYEKMYDVQVDSIDHRYYSNGILSHNSTTAAGYLLWYAMFNSDSTVLIASNKYTSAQEIMNMIRFAYELCPDHIRCGVVDYNKGSITFDNGSRIVSATTTETTGRGMAISLLYCLDGDTTTVKIRNKTTLVEEEISMSQLWCRLNKVNKLIT